LKEFQSRINPVSDSNTQDVTDGGSVMMFQSRINPVSDSNPRSSMRIWPETTCCFNPVSIRSLIPMTLGNALTDSFEDVSIPYQSGL